MQAQDLILHKYDAVSTTLPRGVSAAITSWLLAKWCNAFTVLPTIKARGANSVQATHVQCCNVREFNKELLPRLPRATRANAVSDNCFQFANLFLHVFVLLCFFFLRVRFVVFAVLAKDPGQRPLGVLLEQGHNQGIFSRRGKKVVTCCA